MNQSNLRPLKILFVLDAFDGIVGGGQIYAKNLKKGLETKYGCCVDIIAPVNPKLFYRLFWTLWMCIKLSISLKLNKYDIVHTQGYNTALIGYFLTKLGNKVVHTVHGANTLDKQTWNLKFLLELILLTKLKVTRQISVSISFLKFKNINTVEYIPNGIQVEEFTPTSKKSFSLEPSILWIGRNDRVKGLDVFKESIKLLNLKTNKFKTKIILDGKLTPRELSKIYQECDIFVQSSLSEGFSLVILEAMASKLIVVATKVGDNELIIEDKVNGFLVDINDPKMMSEKILKAINLTNSQKEKISELAAKKIASDYSINSMVNKTFNVYLEII